MRFVCLWSPGWSTGAAPGAESAAPAAGVRRADGGEGGEGGIGRELATVLPAVLAEVAPRVRLERERVWVDGRGLVAQELVPALLRALTSLGVAGARAGVAEVPIVAWAAARCGDGACAPGEREAERAPGSSGAQADSAAPFIASSRPRVLASDGVLLVPPGAERRFLAAVPLDVLVRDGGDPRVIEMLAGAGVETCGALAALEREAVEVRFGAEGVHLWRLARGDDARLLFEPVPPERPQASLDFLEYVVTDPERLAFTVNALLGSICDALRERGEHARRMTLVLELAGGGRWEQGLRPGRPSGSRAVWLRLARAALERATLGDAVAGVHLEVEATEPAAVRQGDLFDAGFATAPAVEAAVLRLLESQGEVVVRPEADAHPLAERRVAWRPVSVDEAVSGTAERGSGGAGERASLATSSSRRSWAAGLPKGRGTRSDAIPRSPAPPLPRSEDDVAALTLQLLQDPRDIRVETELRRDHALPVRYRDRDGWHQAVTVAGPERVSGGQWEDAYAREYFRVATADGLLVWIFRDARTDAWRLHGWWD